MIMVNYVAEFIDNVVSTVRQGRLAHQAYFELSRLTDKELQDIGLNRCDIMRVAYGIKR